MRAAEERERHRQVTRRLLECLELADLAGADRLLAPGAVIRPGGLMRLEGEPDSFSSFTERMGSLAARGRAWRILPGAPEALSDRDFVVTCRVGHRNRKGLGFAQLGAIRTRCAGGRVVGVWSYDTPEQARAAVGDEE